MDESEPKNSESSLLKRLPGVDQVLNDPRVRTLIKNHPRSLVAESVREYLSRTRLRILDGEEKTVERETVIDGCFKWAVARLSEGLKRAVNGTGVILHTGMGRAPLAEAARAALAEATDHYCTLQIDPETGQRGDRFKQIEFLLRQITGAEAAVVVNNNAAATLLILNTLAEGKEAVVSRGELVEIGGSFRIPDIMARSGAKMVEVGTTNRTHLSDYAEAISDQTGLLLRVHQSNYKITGFTSRVPLEDMVRLAHEKGLPVVDDLGSGALVDLGLWGLPREPTVQESVKAGADVVCFSGDKLVGGPQCGIIVGKKDFVRRIRKNPLMRALRCCKMTHSVLEATLRLFLDPDSLPRNHTVVGMLAEPAAEVRKRCLALRRKLNAASQSRLDAKIESGFSETGSGSLAAEPIPTWVVAVRVEGFSADELARRLRMGRPPVFGRIQDGRYILDCRTVRRDELDWIASAFRGALESGRGEKTGDAS